MKNKPFRELKKLKNFDFLEMAAQIAYQIWPFQGSSKTDYDHKYFFICIADFIDTQVSWRRYRGTSDYHIRGRYLNEIHNEYCRRGIYDAIFEANVDIYLKRDRESKLRTQSIDSSFIANKQGTKNNDHLLSNKEKQQNIKIRQDNLLLPIYQQKKERKFIDFNRYNGRKKYFKKDICVDNYGFILQHHTSSSKRHDSVSLDEIVNKLPLNLNTLKNSKVNRYKQHMLLDSGYCSEKNKTLLKNKCYTPLIKYNKRNTKNKKKLAENKMTKNQKEIYKRRSVVEHSFAWLKSRPIINQNYQKTISSYNGLFSFACSLINSKRI